MSAVHVGAYAWSFSILGIGSSSISSCGLNRMEALRLSISSSSFIDSKSLSREYFATYHPLLLHAYPFSIHRIIKWRTRLKRE